MNQKIQRIFFIVCMSFSQFFMASNEISTDTHALFAGAKFINKANDLASIESASVCPDDSDNFSLYSVSEDETSVAPVANRHEKAVSGNQSSSLSGKKRGRPAGSRNHNKAIIANKSLSTQVLVLSSSNNKLKSDFPSLCKKPKNNRVEIDASSSASSAVSSKNELEYYFDVPSAVDNNVSVLQNDAQVSLSSSSSSNSSSSSSSNSFAFLEGRTLNEFYLYCNKGLPGINSSSNSSSSRNVSSSSSSSSLFMPFRNTNQDSLGVVTNNNIERLKEELIQSFAVDFSEEGLKALQNRDNIGMHTFLCRKLLRSHELMGKMTEQKEIDQHCKMNAVIDCIATKIYNNHLQINFNEIVTRAQEQQKQRKIDGL